MSRYGVATAFLVLVAMTGLVTASLSPRQDEALELWASTNLVNFHHHPVPALVLSAFLPQGSPLAWLPLIALAMFGANRAVGNLRLALVCAAGHLIGTAISEGVVAYRVDHGHLSRGWSHIIDIGPSYIVVAAIVIAVVFGSWPARFAALTDLAMLVFIGNIFSGLTKLEVAPVGHLTAVLVAAVLSVAFMAAAGAGRDARDYAPPA
jgi:hypothetical protein